MHIESKFALIYNLSAISWLGSLLAIQWFWDQYKATAAVVVPPTSASNPAVEGGSSETTESCRTHGGSGHSFWLVILPLAAYVTVFCGQCAMVLWVDLPTDRFRIWTLVSMGFCGLCGATASAGILATAGLFPAHISTGPFLAGQSFGGVGVSVANLLAAALEDPADYWDAVCATDNNGTESVIVQEAPAAADTCVPYEATDMAVFGYFGAGSLVLLASLCGYLFIDHFQRHHHRNEYETVEDLPSELALTVDQSPRVGLELLETQGAGDGAVDDGYPHRRHLPPYKTTSLDGMGLARETFSDEPVPDLSPHAPLDSSQNETHDAHASNETAQVFAKVRAPATCIFLVFVVTLGLFPGWVSELHSVNRCQSRNRFDNDLYTPFAFVLFNVGDLGGRVLSSYVPIARIRNMSRKLVSGALLRFLLFPLLALCVGGSGYHRVEIPSNLFSAAVQLLFAVSSGFLVTLAFVYAPTTLPSTTHVQERSSELLNLALALGLLTGSFVSFPVSQVLR